MVALKAELGPKDPPPAAKPDGTPTGLRPGWDVFVAAGSDALPGTGTSLGTFNHNEGTDPIKSLNHVVLHHIQSILARREQNNPGNVTPPAPPAGTILPPGYNGPAPGSMWPINFTDMSVIRMKRHGATMLSTAITVAGVSVAVAATATLVIKLQPGDVAGINADHYFTSGSTAIATVSSAGVVTGVAPGNTYVRVVNKYNGLAADAAITVTGAGVFLVGNEGGEVVEPGFQPKPEDDVVRFDDEWPDDRKSAIEDTEKQLKLDEKAAKEAKATQKTEPEKPPVRVDYRQLGGLPAEVKNNTNTPTDPKKETVPPLFGSRKNNDDEDHTPADTKAKRAKEEDDDDDNGKKKSKK